MINHLRHDQIDKQKWDLCISSACNSRIYAYSWYLDISAPGWEALVYGDYELVFPLTWRKKLVKYLYQPLFTQQLGLFYPSPQYAGMTDEFLACIPTEFRFVEIQLNASNLPGDSQWKVKRRKNFVIDLLPGYDAISKQYSDHTQRNIRKSGKGGLRIEPMNGDAVVDFYVRQKSDATRGVYGEDYMRLKALLKAASDHSMLLCRGVFKEDDLHACAAVYTVNQRMYMICNAVSTQGKESRAMYLLMDQLIREFSGQPMVLDLEGSDIEGVARFNKSFGATKEPYAKVRINRLPWILRILKS